MDQAERIAELEAALKERGERLDRATADLAEARELVDTMRENVEDGSNLIERWIGVFEMELSDKGLWLFDPNQTKLWERHAELLDAHKKLISRWNKHVTKFNRAVGDRDIGRPLGADEKQIAEINRRKAAGESLRKIAAATGVRIRTVRTVLEKAAGVDRTTRKRAELRRLEFDRLRAADFRARHKERANLPTRIGEALAGAAGILKRAKGLGKS